MKKSGMWKEKASATVALAVVLGKKRSAVWPAMTATMASALATSK